MMSKYWAWKTIEECHGWNTGQTSSSFATTGKRTPEDDLLDARRTTLTKAWQAIGTPYKP